MAVERQANINVFEKNLQKTESNIKWIISILKVGAKNMHTLRTLLGFYLKIFFNVKEELPPLSIFQKIVEAFLKSSFQGCLDNLKTLSCETHFKLCTVKLNECKKRCINVKKTYCNEQQEMFDLIGKIDLKYKYKLSCERFCNNSKW